MQPPLANRTLTLLRHTFVGEEGACGRVLLSWALAGGVATGGIVVGALTLTGRVSPGLQLLMAPALFLVGVALGFMHGAVLAVLGRPDSVSLRSSAVQSFVAGVCSIPGLGLAWVITAGISVSAALVLDPRLTLIAVAGTAWILGLVICSWAVWEGWCAVCRALRRFPRLKWAFRIAVAAVPAVLLPLVMVKPPVPGTGVTLNWLGAAGVALISAIWLVLPFSFLLLRKYVRLSQQDLNGSEAGL